MSGQYEVRLNNKSLSDLSDKLLIVDVNESDAEESDQAIKNGYGNGSRLMRTVRGSLSVGMSFVIRESDAGERMAIYNRVLAWARNGGWLEISDRMGQRVHVERVAMPSLGSVRKWMGTLSATFTAYSVPFWECSRPVSVGVSTAARTGSVNLLPPGNGKECVMDAEITAVGGTTNALTITADGKSMVFASLGLTVGSVLKIGHTDNGLLTMKIGDTSVMDKRTAASADDLILEPGKKNAISFTSGSTCTAVFKTRGRWL